MRQTQKLALPIDCNVKCLQNNVEYTPDVMPGQFPITALLLRYNKLVHRGGIGSNVLKESFFQLNRRLATVKTEGKFVTNRKQAKE